MNSTYDYYSYESISMMLGLGLKFDFGFRSKEREFHLFVFEVMYRQGLKDIMGSLESKTILDNNEIFRFNNSLGSHGTGVYFQISRNFQLYPWIKSKRKELQEQGIYKSKD